MKILALELRLGFTGFHNLCFHKDKSLCSVDTIYVCLLFQRRKSILPKVINKEKKICLAYCRSQYKRTISKAVHENTIITYQVCVFIYKVYDRTL